MDYRDEVFISVAENLNFSKSAEELCISQPAITNHIKKLESRLNIALFERKGNKIYITKAGKITYSYLRQIKQQYKDLEFELGRINDTFKGALRIGASSTISQYVIPTTIAAFYRRYPKIELDLFNGNSFEMEQKLSNNEIDIALVENESSQSDLKYINFLDDEVVAVAGINSVYAKRRVISLSELEQIPIVLREKGSGTLEVIKKSMARNKIDFEKINILIHLGSTESIKNFLYDFDGIALVSEKSIKKELLLKTLVKINVKDINMKRKFRIVLRQGLELKIPELFKEFVLNYNF